MGVAQLFLWARWAAVSRHPSNWKLLVVVIASGLAMLLEIYDFPPYRGYFDAHSIWHLATVPLTILWWSFTRDDAEFRTSSLLKKSKTKRRTTLLDAFGGVDDHWVELITGNLEALPTMKNKTT
ncbi:hypothetical protein YC2023_043046 [Brassica napus]